MKLAKRDLLAITLLIVMLLSGGCDRQDPNSTSDDISKQPHAVEESSNTRSHDFYGLDFGSSTFDEVKKGLGEPSSVRSLEGDTQGTIAQWDDNNPIGASELHLGFDDTNRLIDLLALFSDGATLEEVKTNVEPVLGRPQSSFTVYDGKQNRSDNIIASWERGPTSFIALFEEATGVLGIEGGGTVLVGGAGENGPFAEVIEVFENNYKIVVEIGTPRQFPYVHDEFQLGNFSYLVERVHTEKAVGSSSTRQEASPGAIWLIVRYTIENAGQRTATAIASNITIVDEQNRIFDPSSNGSVALAMSEGIDLAISQLQPGIRRAQVAVFEVPKSTVESKNGFHVVIPEKGLRNQNDVRIHLKLAEHHLEP